MSERDLPEITPYNAAQLGLEIEALEQSTTPGEIFRRRMHDRGYHVVSTGEQRPGSVLQRIGNTIMEKLTGERKGNE